MVADFVYCRVQVYLHPTIDHTAKKQIRMAKLNQKQFRKTYGGLELLRSSLTTYKVGHKAEWERRIRKTFEIEEVFITAFLGLDANVRENLEKGLMTLATSPAVDANFANLEFSGETNISAAMKAGNIPADASAGLKISKTKSFSFENITARSLKDNLRADFISAIKNMQLQNERAYKKTRKLMFIDRLYYCL